jgi:phosphoglycolate phosphatase
MPAFDLVIFDLDGTLVDTLPDVHESINKTLVQLDLPQVPVEQTTKAIGPGPEEFIKFILSSENLHRAPDFYDAFRAIYSQHSSDTSEMFAGMQNLIRQLKKEKVRLALATNKARLDTEPLIAKFGLDQLFDIILTRDDVQNPKPAPDMLLKACRLLNVSPQRTLMLGDTDNDIIAAQNADILSCLALWGYSDFCDLHLLADYTAENATDVMQIIMEKVYQNV